MDLFIESFPGTISVLRNDFEFYFMKPRLESYVVLPRFQVNARPDHVQVHGSSCCGCPKEFCLKQFWDASRDTFWTNRKLHSQTTFLCFHAC